MKYFCPMHPDVLVAIGAGTDVAMSLSSIIVVLNALFLKRVTLFFY